MQPRRALMMSVARPICHCPRCGCSQSAHHRLDCCVVACLRLSVGFTLFACFGCCLTIRRRTETSAPLHLHCFSGSHFTTQRHHPRLTEVRFQSRVTGIAPPLTFAKCSVGHGISPYDPRRGTRPQTPAPVRDVPVDWRLEMSCG